MKSIIAAVIMGLSMITGAKTDKVELTNEQIVAMESFAYDYIEADREDSGDCEIINEYFEIEGKKVTCTYTKLIEEEETNREVAMTYNEEDSTIECVASNIYYVEHSRPGHYSKGRFSWESWSHVFDADEFLRMF